MTTSATRLGQVRLTQYAHGGGCACKIPPGELEDVVAGLRGPAAMPGAAELLVGPGRRRRRRRRPDGARHAWSPPRTSSPPSSTTPSTGAGSPRPTPSPTSTRWAAPPWSPSTCWPGLATCCRSTSPREVLRGGAGRRHAGRLPRRRRAQRRRPGAQVRDGRHRPRRPRTPAAQRRRHAGPPADADQAARPRRPQQPAQGDRRAVPEAVASMTQLNDGRRGRRPRRRARAAPPTSPASACSGTCTSCARASGVTAEVDAAAVPYLDGARDSLAAGYVSGGSRRNLDWVRPHADLAAVGEDEALLLADAQTSGGLLVAAELPGLPRHRAARPGPDRRGDDRRPLIAEGVTVPAPARPPPPAWRSGTRAAQGSRVRRTERSPSPRGCSRRASRRSCARAWTPSTH